MEPSPPDSTLRSSSSSSNPILPPYLGNAASISLTQGLYSLGYYPPSAPPSDPQTLSSSASSRSSSSLLSLSGPSMPESVIAPTPPNASNIPFSSSPLLLFESFLSPPTAQAGQVSAGGGLVGENSGAISSPLGTDASQFNPNPNAHISPSARTTASSQASFGLFSDNLSLTALCPTAQPVKPNKSRAKKRRECTTCAQCRQRRCACSRESPCQACVSRGEGHLCDWTGVNPQVFSRNSLSNAWSSFSASQARLRSDLKTLHARVDKLFQLFATISPPLEVDSNLLASAGTVATPVSNNHVEDVATQLSLFTLTQAIPQILPVSQDLPVAPHSQISVKEVQDFEAEEQKKNKNQFAFSLGSSSAPQSLSRSRVNGSQDSSTNLVSTSTSSHFIEGLLGLGKGFQTVEEILAELPSPLQIKGSFEQYEFHRAWMHRVVNREALWRQVSRQISKGFRLDTDDVFKQRAQLHWLSIVFSVCGLGLFNNVFDSAKTAAAYCIPPSLAAQRELALRWCRAATSCLRLGEFEEHPSFESISGMAILAQLPLYTSDGETLGMALDFVRKAIDLAVSLELHIDPDLHPVFRGATDLVKQDRRRLMTALLCQHFKMCGLLCQSSGLKPPSTFAGLQPPLDQFDEDFDLETGELKVRRTPGFRHTIMTGVRCRFQVSTVWHQIGILFSNPAQPPFHDRVMDFDKALCRIDSEWPESIRTAFDPKTSSFVPSFAGAKDLEPTHLVLLIDRLGCFAVLAAAMIRLHRGFLVGTHGVGSDHIRLHRYRVYHYGRALLAIHRTQLFPLDNVPIQFFVLSSTISLAVYCLSANQSRDKENQEEMERCELIQKELEDVTAVLKPFVPMSSIIRRTYSVLKFSLKKIETLKSERDLADYEARQHKRVRTLDTISENESPELQEFTVGCNNVAISGKEVQVFNPGSNQEVTKEPESLGINSNTEVYPLEGSFDGALTIEEMERMFTEFDNEMSAGGGAAPGTGLPSNQPVSNVEGGLANQQSMGILTNESVELDWSKSRDLIKLYEILSFQGTTYDSMALPQYGYLHQKTAPIGNESDLSRVLK